MLPIYKRKRSKINVHENNNNNYHDNNVNVLSSIAKVNNPALFLQYQNINKERERQLNQHFGHNLTSSEIPDRGIMVGDKLPRMVKNKEENNDVKTNIIRDSLYEEDVKYERINGLKLNNNSSEGFQRMNNVNLGVLEKTSYSIHELDDINHSIGDLYQQNKNPYSEEMMVQDEIENTNEPIFTDERSYTIEPISPSDVRYTDQSPYVDGSLYSEKIIYQNDKGYSQESVRVNDKLPYSSKSLFINDIPYFTNSTEEDEVLMITSNEYNELTFSNDTPYKNYSLDDIKSVDSDRSSIFKEPLYDHDSSYSSNSSYSNKPILDKIINSTFKDDDMLISEQRNTDNLGLMNENSYDRDKLYSNLTFVNDAGTQSGGNEIIINRSKREIILDDDDLSEYTDIQTQNVCEDCVKNDHISKNNKESLNMNFISPPENYIKKNIKIDSSRDRKTLAINNNYMNIGDYRSEKISFSNNNSGINDDSISMKRSSENLHSLSLKKTEESLLRSYPTRELPLWGIAADINVRSGCLGKDSPAFRSATSGQLDNDENANLIKFDLPVVQKDTSGLVTRSLFNNDVGVKYDIKDKIIVKRKGAVIYKFKNRKSTRPEIDVMNGGLEQVEDDRILYANINEAEESKKKNIANGNSEVIKSEDNFFKEKAIEVNKGEYKYDNKIFHDFLMIHEKVELDKHNGYIDKNIISLSNDVYELLQRNGFIVIRNIIFPSEKIYILSYYRPHSLEQEINGDFLWLERFDLNDKSNIIIYPGFLYCIEDLCDIKVISDRNKLSLYTSINDISEEKGYKKIIYKTVTDNSSKRNIPIWEYKENYTFIAIYQGNSITIYDDVYTEITLININIDRSNIHFISIIPDSPTMIYLIVPGNGIRSLLDQGVNILSSKLGSLCLLKKNKKRLNDLNYTYIPAFMYYDLESNSLHIKHNIRSSRELYSTIGINRNDRSSERPTNGILSLIDPNMRLGSRQQLDNLDYKRVNFDMYSMIIL